MTCLLIYVLFNVSACKTSRVLRLFHHHVLSKRGYPAWGSRHQRSKIKSPGRSLCSPFSKVQVLLPVDDCEPLLCGLTAELHLHSPALGPSHKGLAFNLLYLPQLQGKALLASSLAFDPDIPGLSDVALVELR